MNEVWKDVLGHEGYYMVSDLGNIKDVQKHVNINQYYSRGYLRCVFYKNRFRSQFFSHRVVAIAFIPNPKDKPEVNHINGIKDDNNVTNLEWATRSENMQHAVRMGLHKGTSHKGESNGMSKLSSQDVLEIRELLKTITLKEIAKIYNISPQSVWNIKHKKRWKHL
jgi:hypothetical protein